MTDLSDLIARVEGLGAREQIARIIDPEGFRRLFSEGGLYDQKRARAKADEILALLHALAAKEPS